jgi:hypothetical protein
MTNQDAVPPHGDFYVTAKDAGRTGFLLGPYEDARDALANVDRGRDLACGVDDRAVFYAFGTARAPIGTEIRTVFGS